MAGEEEADHDPVEPDDVVAGRVQAVHGASGERGADGIEPAGGGAGRCGFGGIRYTVREKFTHPPKVA
ncbi:hypothetical protein Amsp01_033330 [Amycolatopsis sp. NBRC 101858]|nr:hypothetical protein Amsp01_033330 [Amycolatopsis sp. NBRC 101858]